MLHTQAPTTPSGTPLDEDGSARVLERAAARRAGLSLRAVFDGTSITVPGALAEVDVSELGLELRRLDVRARRIIEMAELRVTLALDGTRYRFDTAVLDTLPMACDAVVRVTRPKVLWALERRRRRRRTLREPCTVLLRPGGDRAATPLATTLLNLSIEGLACRARQVDLTEIEAGPALGIEFEPQGADGSFHLFGRIVSVTPGGTLESVVIGIAFVQDEGWKASRVGLQAALVTAHW